MIGWDVIARHMFSHLVGTELLSLRSGHENLLVAHWKPCAGQLQAITTWLFEHTFVPKIRFGTIRLFVNHFSVR